MAELSMEAWSVLQLLLVLNFGRLVVRTIAFLQTHDIAQYDRLFLSSSLLLFPILLRQNKFLRFHSSLLNLCKYGQMRINFIF
jgi:hypothetical protein